MTLEWVLKDGEHQLLDEAGQVVAYIVSVSREDKARFYIYLDEAWWGLDEDEAITPSCTNLETAKNNVRLRIQLEAKDAESSIAKHEAELKALKDKRDRLVSLLEDLQQ